MDCQHIDRTELDRLAAGALSQRETIQIGLHLVGCGACLEKVASLRSSAACELYRLVSGLVSSPQGASCPPDGGVGREGLGDGPCQMRDLRLPASREERRKEAGIAELLTALGQVPTDQVAALVRDDTRFHCAKLARVLLERSRELCPEAPRQAVRDATCAIEIGRALALSEDGDRRAGVDLEAEGWIDLGSAHRVQSELTEAASCYQRAADLLPQGSRDPLLRARLLWYEGVLQRRVGRNADAERRLSQALAIYRWAGDLDGQANCLISQANVQVEDAGHPERAIPLLEEAGRLIDPDERPRLWLCVRQNLLHSLQLSNETRRAVAMLPEVRELCARLGTARDRLCLIWLEGKLAADQGDEEGAEALLRGARDGFREEGLGLEAAEVSLELAALLLSLDKTAETKALAEEMLPLFHSLDIQRDAFAALILFQQSALREEANASMVRELADCLRHQRRLHKVHSEVPS